MTDFPLLILPRPRQGERDRRMGGWENVKPPDHHSQARRLAPKFRHLQEAMERQGTVLQETPQGTQLELILVIETVGTVEDFYQAVLGEDGLEWLGALNIDSIPPEHGFQDSEKAEKELSGRVYLVFTNHEALNQLMSLFRQWQQDPNIWFAQGLAPFKRIFKQLRDIRPWSAKDRLMETGFLEDYEMRQKRGEENIPFEVELWFRNDSKHRQASQSVVSNLIQEWGGKIEHHCEIEEIRYHGILGSIPSRNAPRMGELIDEIKILNCESVMYIRPVGNCFATIPNEGDALPLVEEGDIPPPKKSPPIVGLLDGYPLGGHVLLEKRLVIDDPDDYESDYQVADRKHGTAMASLICHGDWNDTRKPMESQVYVRPVMKPERFGDKSREWIPEDVLPVDLVHRAVRRMYEAEGEETPAAPEVRIINLSIGDTRHPFIREMSSWARLLDWLSDKYEVLFVVSAGNHAQEILLEDISQSDFESLNPKDQELHIIRAVVKDNRHRRLLSPAETVNGITVASAHMDKSGASQPSNYMIDPFASKGLPNFTSAQGAGYKRSIKPEILFPGGKQLVEASALVPQTSTKLEIRDYFSAPGVLAAHPGPTGSSNPLKQTVYLSGSSNAAAIATHNASFIHDAIHRVYRQRKIDLTKKQSVVLTKALLVHGSEWGDAKGVYKTALGGGSGGATSEQIGRFLGYGLSDADKAIDCTKLRVTAVGCDRIEKDKTHTFMFPLPTSLSSVRGKKRLAITLAWLTPINCQHQNYKIAHLSFSTKCRFSEKDANSHATQRGTIQHQVWTGQSLSQIGDGNALAIEVSFRSNTGEDFDPIDYGLAVTIEIAPALFVDIYNEVKQRLSVPISTIPV